MDFVQYIVSGTVFQLDFVGSSGIFAAGAAKVMDAASGKDFPAPL